MRRPILLSNINSMYVCIYRILLRFCFFMSLFCHVIRTSWLKIFFHYELWHHSTHCDYLTLSLSMTKYTREKIYDFFFICSFVRLRCQVSSSVCYCYWIFGMCRQPSKYICVCVCICSVWVKIIPYTNSICWRHCMCMSDLCVYECLCVNLWSISLHNCLTVRIYIINTQNICSVLGTIEVYRF